MCQTTSAANKFGPCSSDADCGGTQGGCLPTPWITADGIAFPFPLGIKTVFTIAAAVYVLSLVVVHVLAPRLEPVQVDVE